MTDHSYIFADGSADPELQRLRLLESVFDDDTHRWVRATPGSLVARRCLEVGAGAGSIATWLASEVGPDGKVVAMDLDTRFLTDVPDNVEVVQGCLGSGADPTGKFAVAHARYVLIHNADALAVLGSMLSALSPGGTVLIEEPDFSCASALVGPPGLKQSFAKVREAIRAMFAARGMTYALGRELPELVRQAGAVLDAVEYDTAMARGGSALARMMRQSAAALRDKYLATGEATSEDLADYATFATSPECWGIYYATVRIRAHVE
jgi:2-polyprenyl-3-methyl-5-hydroxy-6-metoxy-1,4-benzoquinol methylase